MIQRIDLRGQTPTPAELLSLVPRTSSDVSDAMAAAAALIDDVRRDGEAALVAQAERFDGVRPEALRVPAAHRAEALAGLDPAVRAAIEETIRRVRESSAAQVPPTQTTELGDGAEVVQRWTPVGRVGLYVPGGKAVYPSSVVMNVVPAQTAGVASIALASPAQADQGGRVHPTILAVAELLGVDEIYAMGGAGAVGAFAYGVPGLVERVDLVTGPGNRFVAAAKRVVHGVIGIDAEAGPTDILVIADDSADADLVAADLVSQAEHDEVAAAVLVTTSEALADAVVERLAVRAAATKHSARVQTALGGRQSAVVLVDDLAGATAFSNAFAPEHLEIQTTDPDAVLASIVNAGAIFLGSYSPVSLGDYSAGSNHVLPTGGHARFSSGLSAATFLRPQQVVRYSEAALREVAENIAALSAAEDLPAHGEAVTARFDRARTEA
ncbi:histidinol dehydrogenase [Agromyces atrinae]|uniref:Histidinol dehydrogenase n=1 Tax=Agromyces atrinae TaxID=592376 RepID=A0A4Q2M2V2_9MICO|nr:histidinol dehydrogenase [Agromyces atrinae]NYD65960.1 histidinol dehydrogenase [Agromyces atrinae]RXZ86294.1 histidinol dehydrogenase [Agromyces atrinae]